MLIRISSPWFVAGVDTVKHRAAPIIRYMAFWPPARIKAYCVTRRWIYEELP